MHHRVRLFILIVILTIPALCKLAHGQHCFTYLSGHDGQLWANCHNANTEITRNMKFYKYAISQDGKYLAFQFEPVNLDGLSRGIVINLKNKKFKKIITSYIIASCGSLIWHKKMLPHQWTYNYDGHIIYNYNALCSNNKHVLIKNDVMIRPYIMNLRHAASLDISPAGKYISWWNNFNDTLAIYDVNAKKLFNYNLSNLKYGHNYLHLSVNDSGSVLVDNVGIDGYCLYKSDSLVRYVSNTSTYGSNGQCMGIYLWNIDGKKHLLSKYSSSPEWISPSIYRRLLLISHDLKLRSILWPFSAIHHK